MGRSLASGNRGIGATAGPMDKKQFYRERLFISTGPLYKGRVMIEIDDERFRLATDDEIREAATFISWIQEYAETLSSDNEK
jgi:hypothetical protein